MNKNEKRHFHKNEKSTLKEVQGGSSNPISGYILKRIENSILKRYLYTCEHNIHSSIIYNSQKAAATNEEINKMWYIQLTLKHHGFELHRSTYTWIFFLK